MGNKSKSGKARIINLLTPIVLSDAQRQALELHRKAVRASKQDEQASFKTRLNL